MKLMKSDTGSVNARPSLAFQLVTRRDLVNIAHVYGFRCQRVGAVEGEGVIGTRTAGSFLVCLLFVCLVCFFSFFLLLLFFFFFFFFSSFLFLFLFSLFYIDVFFLFFFGRGSFSFSFSFSAWPAKVRDFVLWSCACSVCFEVSDKHIYACIIIMMWCRM